MYCIYETSAYLQTIHQIKVDVINSKGLEMVIKHPTDADNS